MLARKHPCATLKTHKLWVNWVNWEPQSDISRVPASPCSLCITYPAAVTAASQQCSSPIAVISSTRHRHRASSAPCSAPRLHSARPHSLFHPGNLPSLPTPPRVRGAALLETTTSLFIPSTVLYYMSIECPAF